MWFRQYWPQGVQPGEHNAHAATSRTIARRRGRPGGRCCFMEAEPVHGRGAIDSLDIAPVRGLACGHGLTAKIVAFPTSP